MCDRQVSCKVNLSRMDIKNSEQYEGHMDDPLQIRRGTSCRKWMEQYSRHKKRCERDDLLQGFEKRILFGSETAKRAVEHRVKYPRGRQVVRSLDRELAKF